MEKINRALCGVEDNAEAIRALKTTMASADDLRALKTSVASVDDVKALEVKLESLESALKSNKITYQVGEYKTVNGKSNSSFGTYRIDGPTIFVIAPGDISTRELYFADKVVMTASGTLIFTVSSGVGEIRLCANATAPRMLVIGEATRIN